MRSKIFHNAILAILDVAVVVAYQNGSVSKSDAILYVFLSLIASAIIQGAGAKK